MEMCLNSSAMGRTQFLDHLTMYEFPEHIMSQHNTSNYPKIYISLNDLIVIFLVFKTSGVNQN